MDAAREAYDGGGRHRKGRERDEHHRAERPEVPEPPDAEKHDDGQTDPAQNRHLALGRADRMKREARKTRHHDLHPGEGRTDSRFEFRDGGLEPLALRHGCDPRFKEHGEDVGLTAREHRAGGVFIERRQGRGREALRRPTRREPLGIVGEVEHRARDGRGRRGKRRSAQGFGRHGAEPGFVGKRHLGFGRFAERRFDPARVRLGGAPERGFELGGRFIEHLRELSGLGLQVDGRTAPHFPVFGFRPGNEERQRVLVPAGELRAKRLFGLRRPRVGEEPPDVALGGMMDERGGDVDHRGQHREPPGERGRPHAGGDAAGCGALKRHVGGRKSFQRMESAAAQQ